MDGSELGRILSKAKNQAERLLWFGALLGATAQSQVVVVGGSAIQVYTSDEYVSADIDVVGDRRSLIKTLETWGFARQGRLWSRKDLALWVDPVGRDYTGDRRKLREFVTPYGPVRVAAVEDLIAKRLVEIAVWPDTGLQLFDQALMLASEYDKTLDWDYIRQLARREKAEQLVDTLQKRISTHRARNPS